MKSSLIGLAIGVILLLLIISFGLGSKAEQPVSFNHKKHLEQGLGCDACHRFFKTQTFSGMPDINTCLDCLNAVSFRISGWRGPNKSLLMSYVHVKIAHHHDTAICC